MLYQSCCNNLVTGLIVPSSLLQFVNSVFKTCSNKFGKSSANTSCQQLLNRLVTTCLQVCSNLCVFTCVRGRLSNVIRTLISGKYSCVILLRLFSTRRNFPRAAQFFFVCELSGRTNRKKTKKNCAARGKFRLVENSL